MTELLQQVIAQIEQLPLDRQDAIAARFLAELPQEQQANAIDKSDSWTAPDRLDVIDFSLQYADSLFK
jgi:hypothetical protein